MGVNAQVWALFSHLHGVVGGAVCKKGLFLDGDDGEVEYQLTPDEVREDPAETHNGPTRSDRLSWQFVDMFRGDWEAYRAWKQENSASLGRMALEKVVIDDVPDNSSKGMKKKSETSPRGDSRGDSPSTMGDAVTAMTARTADSDAPMVSPTDSDFPMDDNL